MTEKQDGDGSCNRDDFDSREIERIGMNYPEIFEVMSIIFFKCLYWFFICLVDIDLADSSYGFYKGCIYIWIRFPNPTETNSDIIPEIDGDYDNQNLNSL